MIDYTTLKHQADGTPTWDAFLGITLKVALEKVTWNKSDLVTRVLDELDLPKKIRNMRYQSKYHDLVMPNRVSFALSDLAISGLLYRPKRGIYKITDRGRKLSQEYGINLTRMVVHSQPDYIRYQAQKKVDENKKVEDESPVKKEIGMQQVREWFNQQSELVQDNLLDQLLKMDPYKFEKLMVQLLVAMGYKGDDGQALVTQKSGDDGIDGLINQDPLGLQKVCVQVKRYASENSVGQPEITGFSGAIKLRHTDRGVFITTSSFTKKAIKAAKDLNITLVNGEMLTNLMIQYQVGVKQSEQFNLYQLDLMN